MEKKIRLINANDCPTLFEEKYKKTSQLILQGETHLDSLAEGFTEAHNIILTMPTVDAVPVVHARWKTWEEQFPSIHPRRKNNLGVFCSACENRADSRTSFCPNCGAMMDLEAPHD